MGRNATSITSEDEGARAKYSVKLNRENAKRNPSASPGCSHQGCYKSVGKGLAMQPGATHSGVPVWGTDPSFHKDAQEPRTN